MTLVKVHDLIGPALDWSVAKCEGLTLHKDEILGGVTMDGWYASGYFMDANRWLRLGMLRYSSVWGKGGTIIEQANISIVCCEGDYNPDKSGTPDCYDTYWVAEMRKQNTNSVYGSQGDDCGEYYLIDSKSIEGSTPLIAAMRCYVHSKFGDNIEIPDDLIV